MRRWNNHGQFSIIAALFVAIILVSSVMFTYSSIRYDTNQSQPQILSAIDETNHALKQVLAFTVGYYGSVLQVTGNSSYAKTLAAHYLDTGLENIADIRPEWGTSIQVTDLSLSTNWFMNSSYSQGNLNVTYDLSGLGVSGIAYAASSKLDVSIFPTMYSNKVCLNVTREDGQPFNDLGPGSFKFYLYQNGNSTWAMVNPPDEPVAFPNGTYLIDIPSGINPYSYIIQVSDTRGIAVAASSFSRYTGTLTFNSTIVPSGDYVDVSNASADGKVDVGSHSDFSQQQSGPNGVFDTLTEQKVDSQTQNYPPDNCGLQGDTSIVSGDVSKLNLDDSTYMTLQSYPTAYQSGVYTTIGFDSQNSAWSGSSNSLSWQHTTGTRTDRILLVSIDTFNYNSGPQTVSSVSYGSTQMTISFTKLCSTNPQVRSYVYYLVNPASGTNTITVSFVGSTAAVAGSITYYNVNQTNPVISNTANSGSSQSSQSISLAVSAPNGAVMFGHVATQIASSSYTVSDGAQQTNRWSKAGTYAHGGTTYYCAGRGSEKSYVGGSGSLTWTTTHAVNWAAIAILLQPSQLPSQETCQIILSGPSNTLNLDNVTWTIDASSTISSDMALQLFNYNSGQYSAGGAGYMAGTLSGSNTMEQTITVNAANYRDSIGRWQIKFTATASVSTPFNVSLDLARYKTVYQIYALKAEEAWTSLDSNYLYHPALCINSAGSPPAGLAIEAWKDGTWQTLSASLVSGWNNISISQYLSTPNFAIRFRADNGTSQNTWQLDAVLLRPESDQEIFNSLQGSDAVVAVELLQNGMMRWLGQNLQLTTQTLPIPPIPVKALHVNEVINGVSQEVPFQVEDWASGYTVALGLTNNATVFGNRQMVVFLVNTHVSEFTVWWNGSDQAAQTPMAYKNTYFHDTTGALSNGKISLSVSSDSKFTVTSNVVSKTTSSTANFMRINSQTSTYGAGSAYVIYNGTVRDIIQQEAEWSNGAPNCPNIYSNIVLTLPATASYYTYQVGLTFINSAQSRTLTDLCPVKVTAPVTPTQTQTENGIALNDPIVISGTGIFHNYPGGVAHHWSQFNWGTGNQGTGIMFTDTANQKLYSFDTSATAPTGSLNVNSASSTIEMSPITQSQGQVNSFPTPNTFAIAWSGAIVTFDGTTPIFSGSGQAGLWVLAELPPSIAVKTGN